MNPALIREPHKRALPMVDQRTAKLDDSLGLKFRAVLEWSVNEQRNRIAHPEPNAGGMMCCAAIGSCRCVIFEPCWHLVHYDTIGAFTGRARSLIADQSDELSCTWLNARHRRAYFNIALFFELVLTVCLRPVERTDLHDHRRIAAVFQP